jgi:sialic acid synthase SpsE
MDNISALAAVVLGSSIIEKHITLDRKNFGPDHPFALEPKDLKDLVPLFALWRWPSAARTTWCALAKRRTI